VPLCEPKGIHQSKLPAPKAVTGSTESKLAVRQYLAIESTSFTKYWGSLGKPFPSLRSEYTKPKEKYDGLIARFKKIILQVERTRSRGAKDATDNEVQVH
jgi:hypothetical protein